MYYSFVVCRIPVDIQWKKLHVVYLVFCCFLFFLIYFSINFENHLLKSDEMSWNKSYRSTKSLQYNFYLWISLVNKNKNYSRHLCKISFVFELKNKFFFKLCSNSQVVIPYKSSIIPHSTLRLLQALLLLWRSVKND